MWGFLPLGRPSVGSQEVAPKSEKPTIEGLRSLLERFKEVANAKPAKKKADWAKGTFESDFVEAVRRVAEVLVWGETHDARFLDLFCEERALADFVRLLGGSSVPASVRVQLLQTLSIIVPNIKTDMSLHCLLKDNDINDAIGAKLDFKDEEILAWYVSLLKSLALRLNEVTIRFFFDKKRSSKTFPLFTKAVGFFTHPDLMVRSSVRSITLSVFSFEGADVQRYLAEEGAPPLFSAAAAAIWEVWSQISSQVEKAAAAGKAPTLAALRSGKQVGDGLRDILDEEVELLEYFGDVCSVGQQGLASALARAVLNTALLPLLGCLGDFSGVPDSDRGGARSVAPLQVKLVAALHALGGVVRILGAHAAIIEPLASALMKPSLPVELRDAILAPIGSIDLLETAASGVLVQPSLAQWAVSSEPAVVPNPFRATLVKLIDEDRGRPGAGDAAEEVMGLVDGLSRAAGLSGAVVASLRLDDIRKPCSSTLLGTPPRGASPPSTVTPDSRPSSPHSAAGGSLADATPIIDSGLQLRREAFQKEEVRNGSGYAAVATNTTNGSPKRMQVQVAVDKISTSPGSGLATTTSLSFFNNSGDAAAAPAAQVALECAFAQGLEPRELSADRRRLLLVVPVQSAGVPVGRQHQPHFFDGVVLDKAEMRHRLRGVFAAAAAAAAGAL
eukprot:TRINITY_DN22693_c1_g4_i2.p1 TRINITY_DN22693_c1_g4~~TRINITY_DN22693_c1_g4_i2.p1  ORF type:complete len:673 (+),score=200.64 TRINITY_DN22693_c1_g4_i2:181-2199(+)